MTDTVIPTPSATRAIAGALARHVVTAAGTALVAHGWVDQQTAASVTGPAADYVLGGVLAVGAAGWSAARARLMHARWAQAWLAPARPLPDATPPTDT